MKTLIFITLALTFSILGYGQKNKYDSTYRKYYIGSTFLMLGNLAAENKPDLAQLNFGCSISPKKNVTLEIKTCKYKWVLGIPFGDDFEAPPYKYPGNVHEFGFVLVLPTILEKGILLIGSCNKYISEVCKRKQHEDL